MEETLKTWVEGDDDPSDFYQLLGKRRFHPYRDDLHSAIRRGLRVLLLYQNHPQEAKVRRAQQFQTLLGQAAETFSDDARWLAYEERLLEQMRAEYARGAGEDPAGWHPAYLRRWLEIVQGVHPSRLGELVDRLIPSTSGPAEIPKKEVGLREVEPPQEPPDEYGLAPQSRPPPVPTTPPDDRPTESPPTRRDPRPVPPRERAKGGGPKPPAPPTGGHRRPLPPVPSRRPGKPQPPISGERPRFGAATVPPRRPMPSRRERGDDSGLLLVVGSAIGTAMLLGLICIVILLLGPCRSAPSVPPTSETDSGAPADSPAGAGSPPSSQGSPPPQSPSASPASDGPESPPISGQPPAGPPAVAAQDPPSPTPSQPAKEVPAGDAPVVIQCNHSVSALAWSPDGTKLATASEDTDVYVWDAGRGTELAKLEGDAGSVKALAWSDEGNYLASGSDDGTIRIWKAADWSLQRTLQPDDAKAVCALAWFPGGRRVAAGDEAGLLHLWDASNGRLTNTVDRGSDAGAIQSLKPFPETRSSEVVVGHLDGSILVWEITRSRSSRLILPDRGTLWNRYLEGALPAELARAIVTPQTPAEDCLDLAMDYNNRRLAVAHDDVDIWDISDRDTSIRVRILAGPVGIGYRAVSWRPDGALLAAGDHQGELNGWETSRWKMLFRLRLQDGVSSLAWNPADGNRLAAACQNGTVTIFPIKQQPSSQAIEPPFHVGELLARAEQCREDEDWFDRDQWFDLAKSLSLMDMHRVSSADERAWDRLRLEVREEVESRLREMERAVKEKEAAPEDILILQEIIDLDPDGTAGEQARQLLKQVNRIKP